MQELAIRSLITLPRFRLTLEDTGELVFATGINFGGSEAILAIGPYAFVAEWGTR